MNRDINQSIYSPVDSRQHHKRNRRRTACLSNNLLDNSNSRAIVRPSVTNVIFKNYSSVSIMIMDFNHNKSTTSNSLKVVKKRKKRILTNKTFNKAKNPIRLMINEMNVCVLVVRLQSLLHNICPSCNVDKDLNKEANGILLKDSIHYEYNYGVCPYMRLTNMKSCDTNCNNWFCDLCQNEYDSSKYSNGFDHLYDVKKRCKNMR